MVEEYEAIQRLFPRWEEDILNVGYIMVVINGEKRPVSPRHILGYHAVYQYVEKRTAQGVDWLTAVGESRYTGLDTFK